MVKIITDSTCDLTAEAQRRLDVEVLPLSVHFGDQSFRDGIDITHEEFYSRLAQAETLPTTSQLNPEELAACFRRHLDGGHEVLGVFLSSELSGTYQSAAIARQTVGEGRVFIVDSRNVTFGLGLLVERATALRDEGLNAACIAEEIGRLASRLRLLAVVDTLKYLKMGGRISSATAVVGGILGISPIIAIEDGRVESAGKARGRKAAFKWMEEKIAQDPPDPSLPISFGHTFCPPAMEECMDYFSGLREQAAGVLTGSIGSVVGTHAGPGATGIAYFAKK